MSTEDCVTPTERKTQGTDAASLHPQVRNAEQVEERNVPKFCSPLEEVVFYSALLHSIGLIVGAGVWPAIWLVITFMKSFRCLMLSSKEVNHPLPEIHSG